jgi:hypothetical protein
MSSNYQYQRISVHGILLSFLLIFSACDKQTKPTKENIPTAEELENLTEPSKKRTSVLTSVRNDCENLEKKLAQKNLPNALSKASFGLDTKLFASGSLDAPVMYRIWPIPFYHASYKPAQVLGSIDEETLETNNCELIINYLKSSLYSVQNSSLEGQKISNVTLQSENILAFYSLIHVYQENWSEIWNSVSNKTSLNTENSISVKTKILLQPSLKTFIKDDEFNNASRSTTAINYTDLAVSTGQTANLTCEKSFVSDFVLQNVTGPIPGDGFLCEQGKCMGMRLNPTQSGKIVNNCDFVLYRVPFPKIGKGNVYAHISGSLNEIKWSGESTQPGSMNISYDAVELIED